MNSILSKISSIIIVVAIIFSGFILYKQNNTGSQIIPLPNISGKIKESSEVIQMIKETAAKPIAAATSTINTIATEIDANEIDVRPPERKPIPCVNPIKYKLGIFDTRFGISKSYFLQSINDGANLWNEATGKKLFEYDDTNNTDALTIDLIYDVRQQNTENGKLLGAEIENTKSAADALKVEYEAMELTFTNLKDSYTARLNTFNIDQKTYNDTVNSWNQKGGAPRSEYDALMVEKDRLQKESDFLTQEHSTLTNMLVEINAKISKHNELIAYANEKVNLNNSTAQKRFTEGNYNPNTYKITIYQFNDDIKLKRVLAHELGHALDLDHNQNKLSIMYAVNSATTFELSKEDIDAVKAVCSQN